MMQSVNLPTVININISLQKAENNGQCFLFYLKQMHVTTGLIHSCLWTLLRWLYLFTPGKTQTDGL